MSIYIQKVEEIAKRNKYTKWYLKICSNAKSTRFNLKESKKILGYIEKHHILPKSFKLGGEKDTANLVILTGREHFICHWLLSKMFLGSFKKKMCFAFRGMGRSSKNTRRVFTSLQYNALKRIRSLKSGPSDRPKKPRKKYKAKYIPREKKVRIPWNKGMKYTDEQKQNLGMFDPDRIEKSREIGKRNKGRSHTEEAKQKISNSRKIK